MRKHLKLIIACTLVLQILLVKFIAKFPNTVENLYSNGLYQWISKLMHIAFGWLPFSIGDLFYTLAIVYCVRWLIVYRRRVYQSPKSWSIDIISAISIGYFSFHILWAFNYYRLPLHESLNLKKEYSTESLISTTEYLISTTNALHLSLTGNDSTKVDMPYTKKELLELTPLGYQMLSKKYPHLAYKTRSLKRSIYSLPLTYMGFSGYLNPFTNEAQIDGLIPKFKYPTTASHEIAHQLGYAAENEANFIGCLATINHEDVYFNYSGYAFALRHCLGELQKREITQYNDLVAKVNTGVLKNYREVFEFWKAYQNPTEPLFKSTYNNFLKANNQSDGMKSYSYVVALLVNYFDRTEE